MLDLGELFGHSLLQGLVPLRKPVRLRPRLVVERLRATHGAHPREERAGFEGFEQIFVGAGIQVGNDLPLSLCEVSMITGMNGSDGSAFRRLTVSIPSAALITSYDWLSSRRRTILMLSGTSLTTSMSGHSRMDGFVRSG